MFVTVLFDLTPEIKKKRSYYEGGRGGATEDVYMN